MPRLQLRTLQGTPARIGAVAALVFAAALPMAGCGSGDGEASEAEITAVATTTQVADLVRNVGGDRVEVRALLSPGTDPHAYEPRPSDALALSEAAAVFRSGGDLDSWLAGLLENAGGDAEVVTLIDHVAPREEGPHGHAGEEAHGAEEAADPHWWQDPRNAIAAVDVIAETLSEADPAGTRVYRRNAEEYSRRLRRLDAGVARCMRRVPEEQRKLVTTHDSYGYLAERYDIELIGSLLPSRSSQAQPSAGETAELVERIESESVRAIFPESPLNPELERAVADEAGATVGEPLWADSLGPDGSGGETYVAALASDARVMVEGFTGGRLSCDAGAGAPPRGGS